LERPAFISTLCFLGIFPGGTAEETTSIRCSPSVVFPSGASPTENARESLAVFLQAAADHSTPKREQLATQLLIKFLG